MNSLIQVYLILDRTEQKALHRLLVWVMFMAMLDTLGVVSIMPFIAMLTSPEIISTNKFLAAVYTYFMFENHLSFLLFTGSLVLMVFILALAFKAYVSYMLMQFAMSKEHSISERLFSEFISQPYSWFLSKNSSDLTKAILSEVSAVISFGILPLLNSIAYGAVCIALLILIVPSTAFPLGLLECIAAI